MRNRMAIGLGSGLAIADDPLINEGEMMWM